MNNFGTLFYYISLFISTYCLLHVLLFHIMVLFGIKIEFMV